MEWSLCCNSNLGRSLLTSLAGKIYTLEQDEIRVRIDQRRYLLTIYCSRGIFITCQLVLGSSFRKGIIARLDLSQKL